MKALYVLLNFALGLYEEYTRRKQRETMAVSRINKSKINSMSDREVLEAGLRHARKGE